MKKAVETDISILEKERDKIIRRIINLDIKDGKTELIILKGLEEKVDEIDYKIKELFNRPVDIW